MTTKNKPYLKPEAIEILQRLILRLKKLPGHHFDMTSYGKKDAKGCGTTGCIAYHIVVMEKPQTEGIDRYHPNLPEYIECYDFIPRFASNILGFGTLEAEYTNNPLYKLFHYEKWPLDLEQAYGRAIERKWPNKAKLVAIQAIERFIKTDGFRKEI